MKRNKGFTLIEFLIFAAIAAIILAIAIPNLKVALAKGKAKAYAEKHGIAYTPPIQQVEQKARSNRVSITEVGEAGNITYYIVRDLNTNQEYLVGKLSEIGDRAGLAITKMER